MDTQPVIIGGATPPVPAKLAEPIWNLEYVALTDLLPKSLMEAEQLADSDKKKKHKQKVQIKDIRSLVDAVIQHLYSSDEQKTSRASC